MPSLEPKAVAVYCASSVGKHQAFTLAAESVGRAIAAHECKLIYGGGGKGIMGVVSQAVSKAGGSVTGIVPFAMVAAGGEGSRADDAATNNNVYLTPDSDKFQTIVVDSMHDRKVKMAELSAGFIGLPGGFGTFEEVLEVATWTQLGIHIKPVVLVNVRGFYDPLRLLMQSGIENGFINEKNANLLTFVDGPANIDEHDSYDWGKAAFEAVEAWQPTDVVAIFNWKAKPDGKEAASGLSAS